MIFLSDLQRRQVVDSAGRRIGRLVDVVVQVGDLFPGVSAIVVESPTGRLVVPWSGVDHLDSPIVTLNAEADPVPDPTSVDDVRLGRDLLDRQIVDTKGRRVVKVNDLKLTEVRGQVRLVGADVSARGYLRRLGLEWLVTALHLPLAERLITWNYVDPIGTAGAVLQLKVSQRGVGDLHPADIAELLDDLDVERGAALLGGLTDPVAAGALSELDPDLQEDLLERIGAARAADLLEIMAPDDAADILGELPADRAEAILAGMEPADAAEVRDLLRYDDESAGGIMSPEAFVLPERWTVEDAIARLRTVASQGEVASTLFVVDDEYSLVGAVSLASLVTAPASATMRSIMRRQVVTVPVGADQEEAARLISKYDLLALPVVDQGDRLVGVITVDDIIDVIQEEADEDLSAVAGTSPADVDGASSVARSAFDRFRWLVVGLFGGLVGAGILRQFAGSDEPATILAFGPLLVLVAGQTVAQSLAVVTRGIGLGFADELPGREARIGLLLAVAAGGTAGFGASIVASSSPPGPILGLAVGLSVALTVALAIAVGIALPFLFLRLTKRPRLIGQPLVGPLVGLISLLLYLGLASAIR